jgi:hypothetical protein
MASERALTIRLEKANLIAQLELQRANIAESWHTATRPLASIDHGVQTLSRHSLTLGGLAAGVGIALLVGGNFWLFRKAVKIALFTVPYILSHRKSGVIGFILSLAKKLVFRWI